MKKYALIGEKLSHSFSKEIHERLGGYSYGLWEIQRDELADFFIRRDFCGINVTIPYKQAVIPFLDGISEEAERIGAVNTVINKDGRLFGYNTDFFGLKRLIERSGVEIQGKTALILGSGGTSKTALYTLERLGAKEVFRVSRGGEQGCISYEEALKKTGAEIIINATPRGMYPRFSDEPFDISGYSALSGVFDAVYNPLRTNLVLSAKERGIKSSGGLYMLVAQAARACSLFTGESVTEDKTEEVFKDLEREKENIVLTGMPGCGKSTVGRILAKKLKRPFFDTDGEIEKERGKKPGDIIKERGEEAFRDIESGVIERLSGQSGVVISTGGGAVLREKNMRALSRNGRIVFLDRPLPALAVSESRPLSQTKDALFKLYEKRIDIYRKTAQHILSGNFSPDAAAEKIAEMIK